MAAWVLRQKSGETAPNTDVFVLGALDVGDGLILATYNNDAWITKVDYEGVRQWQISLSYPSGYLLGCEKDSLGNIYLLHQAGLIKLSPTGAVLWKKVHSAGYTAACRLFVDYQDRAVVVVDGAPLAYDRYTTTGTTLDRYYRYAQTDEYALGNGFNSPDSTGNIWQFSKITTGDDKVAITQLQLSTVIVPIMKTIGCAGHQLQLLRGGLLSTGDKVFIAYDDADVTKLHIVCFGGGGVVWSKQFTDSGVPSFAGVGTLLGFCADGFFLSYDSRFDLPIFKFDNSGNLIWQRVTSAPGSSYGWAEFSAIATSDGDVLIGSVPADAADLARGALIKLHPDGNPTGTFGSGEVSVSAITRGAVATGLTYTVAAGPSFSITSTTGVSPGANALSITNTAYEFEKYTSDTEQARIAEGHKTVFHGQASSPYLQAAQATGTLETTHGVATSFTGVGNGVISCQADGAAVTSHGSATGAASVVSMASGQTAVKHGVARGVAGYVTTGITAVTHGIAAFASLFRAGGTSQTRYGTANTLLPCRAIGRFVTAYGVAATASTNTNQATGAAPVRHGEASMFTSFLAKPSFRTRYGIAKTTRSITC